MLERFFTVNFGGTEFQALYVREKSTALVAVEKLMQKDCVFSIDVETEPLPQFKLIKTAGLSPWMSKIRLMQVFDGKTVIIFDLKHIQETEFFIPFLESKKFIAHNAIFELQFFKRLGVKQMDIGCTMLAAKLLFHSLYVTDAGLSASLSELSKKLLKIEIRKDLQVSDWTIPDLTFEQVEYAAIDAVSTSMLAEKLVKGLNNLKLQQIYKLYKNSLHPIADIQLNGIRLNIPEHRLCINQWKDELYKVKKEILETTKLERITSTTLGDYLERTLDKEILAVWPKTETGRLSTDANTFSDFSFLDIVKPFSEYQKKDKLTSSFGVGLLDFVNPVTGKIHAQYHICGTRSGRLSCSKCNIQQSPRDKAFRKLFVADEGTSFICADYSAIEVRAAAEISRDKNMIKAFKSGVDIYTATAAALNRKKVEEVTKEERQRSKCLVLGLQFGLGAKKLGHYAKKGYGVEFTQEESYKQVEAYRNLYSDFREWQLNQVQDVADNNFVVDAIFGKKRKLDPSHAYGTALNHPIQSSCASMMLIALIELKKTVNGTTSLIASVHDEIIIQCKSDKIEETKELLKNSMEQAYETIFPEKLAFSSNLVSVATGPNWGEAKP